MLSKHSTVKPILKSTTALSKAVFKNSRCLLTISVGQEVHESQKFLTTLKLVEDNFTSCVLLIDDTLQRHTMALQKSKDSNYFYEHSLKQGNLWLERNKPSLQILSIPHEILRWDHWLKHPHYHQQNQRIITLIKTDPIYKQAFDNTIHEFLRRYYARLQNKNTYYFEKDFILCLNYLIEECTAFCLWPELECHFELYPSKRNLAMNATYKHFILPRYPNLLHDLSIKFKNRKQLKAQCFEPLLE